MPTPLGTLFLHDPMTTSQPLVGSRKKPLLHRDLGRVEIEFVKLARNFNDRKNMFPGRFREIPLVYLFATVSSVSGASQNVFYGHSLFLYMYICKTGFYT
jgi:hypothetical protein